MTRSPLLTAATSTDRVAATIASAITPPAARPPRQPLMMPIDATGTACHTPGRVVVPRKAASGVSTHRVATTAATARPSSTRCHQSSRRSQTTWTAVHTASTPRIANAAAGACMSSRRVQAPQTAYSRASGRSTRMARQKAETTRESSGAPEAPGPRLGRETDMVSWRPVRRLHRARAGRRRHPRRRRSARRRGGTPAGPRRPPPRRARPRAPWRRCPDGRPPAARGARTLAARTMRSFIDVAYSSTYSWPDRSISSYMISSVIDRSTNRSSSMPS